MPSPPSLVSTEKGSLLDGAIKIPELGDYLLEQGMTSCGISDHGQLFGIIDFYKQMKKRGIRPLLAVESYITADPDGIEDNKNKTRDNMHCILIAKNNKGLSEIIRLTNLANINNYYYKPRISIENLKTADLKDNIVCTSACLGSFLAKGGRFNEESRRFEDEEKKAMRRFGLFKELFQGNFYAEIQDNPEFWQQSAYNDWLIKEAKRQRVPLVITSDAHFLRKEDKELHDIVMAQQLKITLQDYSCDEDGMAYTPGHYVRTPNDMLSAAIKYGTEDAFWNTTEIAKGCEVEIKLGEYENPDFDITQADDYEDFLRWKEEQNEY